MPRPFHNTHPHRPHHVGHILQWKLGLRREVTTPIDERWKRHEDLHAQAINAPLIANPPSKTIQVTWIGHASFLVQVAGHAFLFDPVFGSHCSPVPLPGLKRLHPPAMSLIDLPRLDGIFVSHNHYDHLEKSTIATLGTTTPCHVPSGLGSWFSKLGVRDCREYSWWDSVLANDSLTISAVPSQHFSSRGLHDRDRTLWCGWVLELHGTRIYFVGDTGYSPVFQEIHQRVGPMDLSIIPIGAYRPRWVMESMHVDPYAAVQIHLDVASRQSIASHWGTFQLTDEPLWEPPAVLRHACSEAALAEDAFQILQIGETKGFPCA